MYKHKGQWPSDEAALSQISTKCWPPFYLERWSKTIERYHPVDAHFSLVNWLMFPNSNKYIVHISTNYSNFYFLYFISAGKLCNKETWSKALNFYENFENCWIRGSVGREYLAQPRDRGSSRVRLNFSEFQMVFCLTESWFKNPISHAGNI